MFLVLRIWKHIHDCMPNVQHQYRQLYALERLTGTPKSEYRWIQWAFRKHCHSWVLYIIKDSEYSYRSGRLAQLVRAWC
jgi:hypothetical protein